MILFNILLLFPHEKDATDVVCSKGTRFYGALMPLNSATKFSNGALSAFYA